MAMSSLERLQKFRKTEKGKAAMRRLNDSIQGTQQRRALYYVGFLVKSKRLPKANTQKCTDCGGRAAVYDHRDYAKPGKVEPVCRSCNYKRGPGLNKAGKKRTSGQRIAAERDGFCPSSSVGRGSCHYAVF